MSRSRNGLGRSASGLTLIELMVALTIFAILGVVSLRAVTAAVESRERLAGSLQRWGEITRFLQMAESDLLQVVARPASEGGESSSSMVVVQPSAGNGAEISFLRLDGERNSVRRRGYRQEGDRVVLIRSPGIDRASTPAKDIVLANVKNLRFSLISQAGRRSAFWPPEPALTGSLPVAVELELELPDAGTIRRLFALR